MEIKNYNCSSNIIYNVEEGSIAHELNIEPGDILLSINGQTIKDIIDYKFEINDSLVILEIEKENGDIWEIEVEKDYSEDLGLEFSNPLIDRAKYCSNKCMFCFIDQLPKNMRDTLYFKDDDSRLSFLQGNFITLTNMSDDEIDRIIKYRITPINVSVHTTNPDLRIKMLKNKKAGKIMEYLERFHNSNLEINVQIVLVPGVNDGEEFIRTITDLARFKKSIKSVAAVPVGITKYREGLEEVKPFNKKSSQEIINITEELQKKMLLEHGSRFIFLSDEFYLLADQPLPNEDAYEGYPQIENGVGLVRSLEREIHEYLSVIKDKENIFTKYKNIVLATGVLAYDFILEMSRDIMEVIPYINLTVVSIENIFFGEHITVSGLLTGGDLLTQLKEVKGDVIIIPRNTMKSDELIFLDDYTLSDIEKGLSKRVLYADNNGEAFVNTLIKGEIQ